MCKIIQDGFLESSEATFAFKGEQFSLTTSTVSRRKVHKQHILLLWTATTPIANTSSSLVEECVLCLRDSLSPTLRHAGVVQYWYRIHVEALLPLSHGDGRADMGLMEDCALRWRSTISTSYVQSIETMLLVETETDT